MAKVVLRDLRSPVTLELTVDEALAILALTGDTCGQGRFADAAGAVFDAIEDLPAYSGAYDEVHCVHLSGGRIAFRGEEPEA